MNLRAWAYIAGLALASVFIFVLVMWASCEPHYCFFGCVKSSYIYIMWILFLSIFALLVYWYSFTSLKDEHTGMVVSGYYIIALLGVLLASWYLFEMKITPTGWLGIALVVIGVLLFLGSC